MRIFGTLRHIYMQTPVASCELAALRTLGGLAMDQDFEATRTLAQIITFELGGDAECAGFQAACDLATLLKQDDIAPLARIYALSFMPREFLKNVAVCAKLASAANPVAADLPELAALQRLVLRESPMEHELLKAIVLGAFARMVSLQGMFQITSAGAGLRILDTILDQCRVVPGDNATSNLRFSRDLILRSSCLDGLLSVIFHELGHLVFYSIQSPASIAPVGELLPRVLASLVQLLESAVQLKGIPVGFTDGRRVLISPGLSLLCTCDQTSLGAAIRLSMTLAGGPIDLDSAASLAYAILAAMGVDPEQSAAAFSARGVFHFGFPGYGPAPEQVSQRLNTLDLKELAKDLNTKSANWLARLRQMGRLGKDEHELEMWVGLFPEQPRFYGLNSNTLMRDWRTVERLRQESQCETGAQDAEPAQAAARCCDSAALKKALATGAAASSVKLKEIGQSLCVMAQGSQKQYLGPTADEIVTLLETLAANGVDLNERLNEDGVTFLTQASLRSEELIRFLISHGADVHRARKDGKTPLLLAASFGSLACVQVLVEAGSNLEARDEDGATALLRAVQRGDEPIVRYLLDRGADAKMHDNSGATVLMAARTAKLVRLNRAAGCDANCAMPGGMTALMHAAAMGRPQPMQALMETGADPEAVTDAGVTALHFCAQWTDEPSRIECAELLVKAGADVNEETRSGETVLMIAAEHNLDRLVKWLVDRGADVNQADQQGNTALHHAMNARTEPRPAILEILMKAGADPLCPNAEGKTVASLAKKFKAEDPVRQLTRKRMKKGVAL